MIPSESFSTVCVRADVSKAKLKHKSNLFSLRMASRSADAGKWLWLFVISPVGIPVKGCHRWSTDQNEKEEPT